MRILAGIVAAALPGLAVGATQQRADVFVFQNKQQSASPERHSLPKEVARHILLQRTSRHRYGSDLRDIPSSFDSETVVEYIATYGRNPTPLFVEPDTIEAAQLVVILEGVTPQHTTQLERALGEEQQHTVFTISDPPSALANDRLMTLFKNLGISSASQCDVKSVINPSNMNCWDGPSSVVRYDLAKSPETFQVLLDNLSRLSKFVRVGDLEAVLVLMPESTRSSKLNDWSAAAGLAQSDLRRRGESETVIADETVSFPTSAPPTALDEGVVDDERPRPQKFKSAPQCFTTFNSCMAGTGNCTSHGQCVNKYGENSTNACFSCSCVPSIEGGEIFNQTIYWGGSMCQKKDISVPFWLLTGFTVTIVGVVTAAIGLLFSVGEEQLPGVIGAGVSRTK
ncbi:hypothetical protein B0T26DRAFT_631043 [Lasiosphaeria miniovina]|uniref:Vacuolar sorting protein Vps3844 C-terminal domain-containing protein n=1 Tax=Lasiosphaeria miniovina TaxID=1954250 RepID=A0AA40BJA0_9PEZI|nr:uncharacterized protein B0T26DRAFT_631043 [Lasiosphaeria miniovina]KAK0735255.1 hypothetical protein B0T26DRAFT_631043 [Lasiosphaeria miniovina]